MLLNQASVVTFEQIMSAVISEESHFCAIKSKFEDMKRNHMPRGSEKKLCVNCGRKKSNVLCPGCT